MDKIDRTKPPMIDRMPTVEARQLFDQLLAMSRASALEEMASGVAHELNQPLGAIVTFAQAGVRILDRTDMSVEKAREVFQLISKEALAAADGIRHMRTLFARDDLRMASCAMKDVLAELSPVLQTLAASSGAVVHTNNVCHATPVCIDRLKIQNVVLILVQNALEASSSNATVHIALHCDRYNVEVSVIDAGSGIAVEHRSRVFHPFFTTKPNGTGLGLCSARSMIEAHEGTIGFEPLMESGTRFWFRIPVEGELSGNIDDIAP